MRLGAYWIELMLADLVRSAKEISSRQPAGRARHAAHRAWESECWQRQREMIECAFIRQRNRELQSTPVVALSKCIGCVFRSGSYPIMVVMKYGHDQIRSQP